MKRYSLACTALLAAFAVLVLVASPVRAEDRQVTFASGSLQNYLNGVGENINVTTAQEPGAQRWSSTISNNSAMTLMIEMAVDASGNSLGVYNAGDAVPTLFQIFPGSATAGEFAMAAFRSAPDRLIVTRFDANGNPGAPLTHFGVNSTDFGYYISNVGGVGFSQDERNTSGLARMLAYKGTGRNEGNWWLCFEDNVPAQTIAPEDRDFDDAIVFVESINPTPVSRTSWGQLKSRFR